MTFTPRQVRENWGEDGLEIIEDLNREHGGDKLPDPIADEQLLHYLKRCQALGLCHVAGDKHNLRDVLAWKAAEAKGLSVYGEVDADEPQDANAGLDPETKALTPTERFTRYLADAKGVRWTVSDKNTSQEEE